MGQFYLLAIISPVSENVALVRKQGNY